MFQKKKLWKKWKNISDSNWSPGEGQYELCVYMVRVQFLNTRVNFLFVVLPSAGSVLVPPAKMQIDLCVCFLNFSVRLDRMEIM